MTNIKIAEGTVHTIPKDMKDSLVKNQKILEIWENLTPIARNEWICWIISVKRTETRTKHIETMVSQLKEGKKRPCCWYGCIHRTDKPISQSIQGLISKKKISPI